MIIFHIFEVGSVMWVSFNASYHNLKDNQNLKFFALVFTHSQCYFVQHQPSINVPPITRTKEEDHDIISPTQMQLNLVENELAALMTITNSNTILMTYKIQRLLSDLKDHFLSSYIIDFSALSLFFYFIVIVEDKVPL